MKKNASANTAQRIWLSASFLVALISVSASAQVTDGIIATLSVEDKAPAASSSKTVAPVETCKVKNFGQVTENYFRGAQPKPEQYNQLAAIGVKTIIDLRDETEGFAKSKAQAAGLNYINVPMSDTKYPPQETLQRFLDLMKDESIFPIYVHCHGGRHRTGVVTAVYRMTFQDWDIDKAYDEMKDYDFYTRWGHKAMKTFVFDYWNKLQTQRKEAALQTSAPAPATQAVPATIVP